VFYTVIKLPLNFFAVSETESDLS